MILILAFIPILLNFSTFFNNPNLAITSVCYFLLFFFISFKILKEPFFRDEFNSDEFASIILKNNFNVDKPSQVVNSTFQSLSKIYEEMEFDSITKKLLFAFFSYHPTNEDRIENIRRKFDSKG